MRNPRTEATQVAYNNFKDNQTTETERTRFNFVDETIVAEYTYWYIIRNRFPYDTMVRVNDMLVSKRAVATFKELEDEELNEYEDIMAQLTEQGTYDALIQNFPHVQSVSRHVHVHLVCWHNTIQ